MRREYTRHSMKIVGPANQGPSAIDTLDLKRRANAARGEHATMTGATPIPLTARPAPAWLARLPRLVLASQSPRRRELMLAHGLDHDAIHPGVDDGLLDPGQVPPEQWVKALAYYKARAGARLLAADPVPKLVIAADTICLMDGRVIGQPADAVEAESTLRAFAGREHDVLTGVAILRAGAGSARTSTRVIFADRATVFVGPLSEGQLTTYLASGLWRGKAGAYNLSERIEAGWPIRFTGDPTTVVGLPCPPLLATLERLSRTVD